MGTVSLATDIRQRRRRNDPRLANDFLNLPAENRLGEQRSDQGHRPLFGGAHAAFFSRFEVVVACEVQPAMDDVEREFGAKIVAVFGREGGGGVGGHADLPGRAEGGFAGKGDHIGGGGVIQKLGMEIGDGVIIHEGEGEFSRRGAVQKMRPGGIQLVDQASEQAPVHAEAGVGVVDGNLSRHGGDEGGGSGAGIRFSRSAWVPRCPRRGRRRVSATY